jgi:hypothetical protein
MKSLKLQKIRRNWIFVTKDFPFDPTSSTETHFYFPAGLKAIASFDKKRWIKGDMHREYRLFLGGVSRV